VTANSTAKRDWSDLGSRIASAIVLGVVSFSMIVFSVGTTSVLAALGCGIMGWEWRRISGSDSVSVTQEAVVVAATAIPAILVYLAGPLVALIVAVIGVGALSFIADDKAAYARRTGLGLFVIALAGICFVWLRSGASDGLHVSIWLPFTVIAADVGAYFAGRFIGGPKLAPTISPNKTVSGALGGQLAAIIVGTAYCLTMGVGSVGVVMAMSLVTAIVSQLGDLTESALKRSYGVKDTSALIPGHGGLLDRFDGLIAAILFVALVTSLSGSTVLAW